MTTDSAAQVAADELTAVVGTGGGGNGGGVAAATRARGAGGADRYICLSALYLYGTRAERGGGRGVPDDSSD